MPISYVKCLFFYRRDDFLISENNHFHIVSNTSVVPDVGGLISFCLNNSCMLSTAALRETLTCLNIPDLLFALCLTPLVATLFGINLAGIHTQLDLINRRPKQRKSFFIYVKK